MMTEYEKAHRLEVLTELFIGFGQPIIDERLKFYGNVTQHVPPDIFKPACRSAAAAKSGGFVPSPGDIIEAALRIAPGERSPVSGIGLPKWYRKSLGAVSRREKPKEISARGVSASLTDIASKAVGS